MAEFRDDNRRGSRFERVDLTGAQFDHVHLNDATLGFVELLRVRMHDVDIDDVEIEGEIGRLIINGVDVGAVVEAELNRRDPERAVMRPQTPDGFREAWSVLESRWSETVRRAGRLPAGDLHTSVDGEWSFTETLRHLLFVTESWLTRAILGTPSPWHPLSLPWDGMPDTPGVPRDRAARPSLETVLAVRADRQATVRAYLASLTEEILDSRTKPVPGAGWPPPRSFPVRECLRVLVNEEWQHARFAERDLAVLESGRPA